MKIETTPNSPNVYRITREPHEDWPQGPGAWWKVCGREPREEKLSLTFPANCERLVCVVTFGEEPEKEQCPFTFSHTRAWCGNPNCRES